MGRNQRKLSSTLPASLGVALLVLLIRPSLADDWPQILGPDRNGRATGQRVRTHWPESGPPVVWQRDVGAGYAGLAASRGRAILFHRLQGKEVVEALDLRTGKTLWKASAPTYYRSGIAPDDGPRCVPTIHEDAVYLYGADGRVSCHALADGKQRWARDTRTDFDAPEGYFGSGSSPLVEDGKLLVNVGGRDGAGIVAFDLATGKTLWQATDEAASYSSPVAATIGGERHAIFVTRLNVVSLDPQSGKERFRLPFGMRGPTVNAANPLVRDGHLFLSASYGIGAKWVQIDNGPPNVLWENNNVMSSQYTTCVPVGKLLVGINGRQDAGVAHLRCFDPRSGKVQWAAEAFGMATLIAADNALLAMKTDGELVLVEPSAERFRRLASARLFDQTSRALPALADGRLLVRDSDTLKCVDLRPQ